MKVFISNNLDEVRDQIYDKELVENYLLNWLGLINKNPNVRLLDPILQLKNLIKKIPINTGTEKNDLVIGIGSAGMKIIEKINQLRFKQFSNVTKMDLTRIENQNKGYTIKNNSQETLNSIIESIKIGRTRKLVIVGDTIYSGMTVK